jgi:hypothetical protein
VDASGDARRNAGDSGLGGGRIRSLAKIAILDVGAPLATYSLLRSAGLSTVSALILSGLFPALGVATDAIRHRRLDVVGALVLAGIVAGTVLGLVSHSARLVLMEGSVPTAIFAVGCLGSLRARRPLMFSLSVEFIGPDSAKGREMTAFWEFAPFRRIFRIITAVWGAGLLIEAGLRAIVVYNTSTGTALAISKVTPFIFIGILLAWTFAFGTWHRRRAIAKGHVQVSASGELTPADDPDLIHDEPLAAGSRPAEAPAQPGAAD